LNRVEFAAPPGGLRAAGEDMALAVSEANGTSGAATPGRTGTPLRRVIWILLGFLLLVALALGGIAWQATHGVISLGFLRDRIESAVRARLPPNAAVAIGSAALSYRDGGLVLVARHLALTLPGTAEVQAGEFSTVTTLGAVAGGRLDLSTVTVSDMAVAVAPGLGAAEPPAAGPPAVAGADTLAARLRNGAAAIATKVAAADDIIRSVGLDEVTIRSASFRMLEAADRPGPALRIGEASWAPGADGNSTALLELIEPTGDSWNLRVERRQDAAGADEVRFAVDELPVRALAPTLADPAAVPHVISVLGLQARVATAVDGGFSDLDAELSIGPGSLALTERARMELESASLRLQLGADGNRVAIPEGRIATRRGSFLFDGGVDLAQADRASLQIQVRGGELPSSDPANVVPLTGGGALVHLDLARLTLDIERFELAAAEGTASTRGQVRFRGPGSGVAFTVGFGEMPAHVLRAFWPPFVAGKTRAWFDENVKSGIVGPGDLQIALPSDHIGRRGRGKVLPPDGLVGDLSFRDGAFRPAKTFPLLRGAAGHIQFAHATADIQIRSGVMSIPGEGDLDAAGTRLVIPELGRRNIRGDLLLEVSGPVPALVALSDTPPLAIATKKGLQPGTMTGAAQLSLSANIPLEGGDLAGVEPSFRLALSDFSSTVPIQGRTIGEADLVLEGSARSYTVKGEGLLDGIQASLDLTLGEETDDQTAVTLSLDEAAREKLGLSLGGMLAGPVEAVVNTGEDGKQHILLDLGEARINAAALGWEKGAGVPATAKFTLAKSQSGTRITDLVLAGKGFGAKGSVALGPGGKLVSLELSELALRPGDRLAAKVKPAKNGYEVALTGRALDARGLIRSLRAPSGGSTSGAAPASAGGAKAASTIRIALDLAEVTGQDNAVLSDLSGSLVVVGTRLERADLKGRTAGNAEFEWTLGRDGDNRVLRLLAADGGALMRFAGLYSRIEGGNLVLDYSGAAGGAGSGVLVMRDFRIVGEAALQPAVQTARRVVADRDPKFTEPLPNSRDLSFSQVRVPFRQDGWVLTIDDAALRGALLGATASGTVNIPGRAVAISGTFIPAFGLNNIAGSIPVLGAILGGGRNEGLVGITYKLYGPLDGPQLTMNPVSAIAPGIFRKIFEYR